MARVQGTTKFVGVLSDYLDVWIEQFLFDRQAQNLSAGTLRFYRLKLRRFAEFCHGRAITRVQQITPADLRHFLVWLEESGHNAGGRHAYYRAVRSFLLWYEAEEEPEGWTNPIRKVKAPRVPVIAPDPLGREAFEQLLEACGGDWHGIRDRAIFLVLLDTGVRASELCDFDLADLDLQTGALEVRQGKGRKPRGVFIGRRTRRALRAWLRQRDTWGGPLFITQEGERMTYWGLRGMLKRRSAQADIDPPTLHDFRRAFCLAIASTSLKHKLAVSTLTFTSTGIILFIWPRCIRYSCTKVILSQLGLSSNISSHFTLPCTIPEFSTLRKEFTNYPLIYV